jgi:hypothetical protein
MFNDLSNLTSSQLRDKRTSYESFFEVLKIIGSVLLVLSLAVLSIVIPAVGLPITVLILGFGITFAILRFRAINDELKKR